MNEFRPMENQELIWRIALAHMASGGSSHQRQGGGPVGLREALEWAIDEFEQAQEPSDEDHHTSGHRVERRGQEPFEHHVTSFVEVKLDGGSISYRTVEKESLVRKG